MQTEPIRPGPFEAALQWLAAPAAVRLFIALAITALGVGGIAVYESVALGWPIAREEPAILDAYHMLRMGFAALCAGAVVAAAVAARAPDCGLERRSLDGGTAPVSLVTIAGALAAAGLLALDPVAFHRFAREDSLLEWVSALLLFAGAVAFLGVLLRGDRPGAGRRASLLRIGAALLAAVLFVMAMEEISWMQRVFGFGTPDRLAEVNWQGEFNLHNIQTDLSETIYYCGAALFLIFAPLLRDLAPPGMARQPLAALIPGRAAAAVSAPLTMLNYGHWNLLPVQITFWLALFVLLAFGRGAAARGEKREAMLFLALAAATAAGQALILAFGPRSIDLPDSTEYKELFIAAGFAFYAMAAWNDGLIPSPRKRNGL